MTANRHARVRGHHDDALIIQAREAGMRVGNMPGWESESFALSAYRLPLTSLVFTHPSPLYCLL